MSKSVAHKSIVAASTRPSQSFIASKIITSLEEIETELALPEALASTDRRRLALQSGRIPDVVIESMAAMSVRHGGSICGLPFDANGARETIASVAASGPVVATVERINVRLKDQVLRKRAAVAGAVETRYGLLQRLAKTPEGASIREEALAMKALLKKHGPRRTKKSATPIAEPVATPVASPATAAQAPIAIVDVAK
jgi:hypothetical protein